MALRATYSLRSEGGLLTVYAELKDVAKAIEARIKTQEVAAKSLLHWAEKDHRHPQVVDFITKVSIVSIYYKKIWDQRDSPLIERGIYNYLFIWTKYCYELF